MTDTPPSRTKRDSRYAKARREYRDRQRAENPEPLRIYGLHAVAAALANPNRRIDRYLATRNALQRLEARRDGLEPEIVEPKVIDRLLGGDAVHQGVVLEVQPLPERELTDLSGSDLVLVLDQVTDPHNVGAILRSAVAMNVAAVVMMSRHAPGETSVLAKAASGALEHVPIIRVRNLADALQELRAQGFRTIGLDSEGGGDLAEVIEGEAIALVLGAEGRGLRQRTRETVDVLTRIDMPGPIRSLNVSNAAALSLYVTRRHLDARKRISVKWDG